MKRPNSVPIFDDPSEYCEKSSQIPVDTLIPGQSIKLSELIARFDRGQRLNVHANFPPGSNFDNLSDDEAARIIANEIIDESMFPSDDVHDVVDVQREYDLQEQHKKEFAEKMRKKQTPQAPPQEEAPQVQLVDPAK